MSDKFLLQSYRYSFFISRTPSFEKFKAYILA
jgi:hypothetical protein